MNENLRSEADTSCECKRITVSDIQIKEPEEDVEETQNMVNLFSLIDLKSSGYLSDEKDKTTATFSSETIQ